MKLRVVFGALGWLLVVTVLHLQLNVGWARLGRKIEVLLGRERPELVVGFLPVT